VRNSLDLFLLVSLVLVLLMYPILDHGDARKVILGASLFVPLILATVRMAKTKGWIWPSLLLMSGVLIFAGASTLFPSHALLAIKWGILTAFFGLTVSCLFSSLKNARTIDNSHLFTAVSSYVLLGLLFLLFTVSSMFSTPARSDAAPRRRQTVRVTCCTSA
jgi:hypothetical protein